MNDPYMIARFEALQLASALGSTDYREVISVANAYLEFMSPTRAQSIGGNTSAGSILGGTN
jgi:hypothetical protein